MAENKELIFNSNALKIFRSEKLTELFLMTKDNWKNIYKQKCHDTKRVKILFLNFDSQFFYGLTFYVQNYNRFRFFFYEFVAFIVKFMRDDYKSSTFFISQNIFVIDTNFFLTALNCFKYEMPNQVSDKKIDVIGTNLNYTSNIIPQWTSLVNSWLNKRIKYENYSAFFSTLGGAYSSLGEESYGHAKNAEKISKKQLMLALEFNDPNAICRSKLFLAFSFIQLLKFKEADYLFRDVFKHIHSEETKKSVNDDRIRIMYKAGIRKLKFTLMQFKEKKAYFSDRGKLRL
ncbi:hypothetical protein BpHYR1_043767 [Brachionus plicatilis]|uniref:Uncharacterized protein n=1 Tax=Brachionus plicatilis TaxID=10195 RepID=A0A3M7RJW3_BRAPC|nr:hypothetical protein BpHYR1_043767 [Brachionus plicatilis]